jgi:hypothetical protein
VLQKAKYFKEDLSSVKVQLIENLTMLTGTQGNGDLKQLDLCDVKQSFKKLCQHKENI